MVQETSALYKEIVSGGNHWFETRVVLDGNTLSESQIMSVSRDGTGLGKALPSVGGALSSILNLTILEPSFDIPNMAEIDVYVRACNATQQSEWIPQGIYYIDTRAHNDTVNSIGTMQITACDAMLKFAQDYPSTNHAWPYADMAVINEMAAACGVTVDSRVTEYITAGYMINLPTGYTMREVLENIAAMYGGNFVITDVGELMFVPLYGLSPDINGNYLADESGNALVFGSEGWCILV